ncbi:hypothetical protein FQN57_002231 [Myotisia sp. PD_48]|nr:hypothetical protein FQN57_002231 [Myotisia sp. PD_48]
MAGSWNNGGDDWKAEGGTQWNDGGHDDGAAGEATRFKNGAGDVGNGNDDACRKKAILRVNALSQKNHLGVASTVVKKATLRTNALSHGSSKVLVASVRRKAIRPLSVQIKHQMFAKIASKKAGHRAMDCTQNRKFEQNDVPDKLPEEALEILRKASKERDLEDFRDGLKIYSKASPLATFDDIEKKLREENLNFYIIGLEREVGDCHTLVNLQGKLNCKYVVGFFFSDKPQRVNLQERWPASAAENLERLTEAGFPLDRQVPKCGNCGQMGHTFKGCKEEHALPERVEVKCVNCKEPGHRARDCKQQRFDRFVCRNCGKPDHRATECPEPRSAEGVECKRCNEVGHFAKDCPLGGGHARTCRNCGEEGHISKDCDQPRSAATVTCRNCEETGHYSRDCTKKKNWTKVKCNNCGEMGHTIKRCPQPGGDNNMGNQGDDSYGGFTYPDTSMVENPAPVAQESSWGGGAPAADGW